MGQAEQRAAIVQLLQQADATAQVHDYERWSNTPEDYLALFKAKPPADKRLKAWVVAPDSVQEFPWTHDALARVILWRIRFLYSLVDKDESEKAALPTVLAAQQLLRQSPTLHGSCWSTKPTAGSFKGLVGLVLDKWSLQVIGPVLCHLADCRLAAQDFV